MSNTRSVGGQEKECVKQILVKETRNIFANGSLYRINEQLTKERNGSMREEFSEKTRRRKKGYDVVPASGLAIVAVALLAFTHGPGKAVSSPTPTKAAIVPEMADAKSEAGIVFRGKSSPLMKRNVIIPYKGETVTLTAYEGQTVKENEVLASYKLDREAMNQVHATLYPEMILNLKKGLIDQRTNLDKLRTVDLKIKQLDLERVQKELADLRELLSKELTHNEAVKNKERQLESTQREIVGIQDAIKQAEASIEKTNEDLSYYEGKHKRDIELLEWQTQRSYSNSSEPLDMGYVKAPIDGKVIWISPDFRVKGETLAGFTAVTIAPMNSLVVRCKVHELDLVKLKSGDRGTVTFDAIPDKKYTCLVSRIPWLSRNPSLEVPADYDIECTIENPDAKIKEGLTCNVKVSIVK
jgi:multidrug resistance efflux pump